MSTKGRGHKISPTAKKLLRSASHPELIRWYDSLSRLERFHKSKNFNNVVRKLKSIFNSPSFEKFYKLNSDYNGTVTNTQLKLLPSFLKLDIEDEMARRFYKLTKQANEQRIYK